MTNPTGSATSSPPLLARVIGSFQQFTQTASAGGIVLLVCTAVALAWANSPWGDSYFHLWERQLTVGGERFGLTKSLHHWINDGLMVVFFFLVGLEIKREMLVGELSSLRQAALPIAGAVGGMVVPAVLYAAVNVGTVGAAGWGIPMATDIAFALGVLALLGSRVPVSLKVFLTALAIVDDIGAVLVIALFYTATISWVSLGVAAVVLVILASLNRAGVRRPSVYAIFGIILWIAFLKSGVHATVAGVLLAMTIPSRTRIDADEFVERARSLIDQFQSSSRRGETVLSNHTQQEAVEELENACEEVQSPLLKLEHGLHGIVAFGIMPLFAFANAGVRVTGIGGDFPATIALGVILGLVIGKPLGITLFSWLAVRTGAAVLPVGTRWSTLHGVSWLGGIGFTMSLFIASLAFPASAELLDSAKLGILGASLLAGVLGWILIRRSTAAATAVESDRAPASAPAT